MKEKFDIFMMWLDKILPWVWMIIGAIGVIADRTFSGWDIMIICFCWLMDKYYPETFKVKQKQG